MRLSVIHLSDIHITSSEDIILGRIDALKCACVSALPAEGIVVIAITGDIAYSGKSHQYAAAEAFIKQLKEYIEAQTNSTVYIVTVPGNHDCDFENVSSIRKALISSLKKEEDIDNEYYSSVVSVQNEYHNFASNYALDARPAMPYKEILAGENKILFLLANTAWMSSLHEVPGTIIMPCHLFPQINPSDYKVVFYMFHHPDNWLNPDVKTGFINHIRQNADMVLLGHEHRKDNYQKIGDSFSVYCNHGKELQNSDNDSSAFSIISFDHSFQNYDLIDYIWEKDHYVRSLERTNQYHKNTFSIQTAFYPNEEVVSAANDLGIAINHFSKENVSLADLFVWPDLSKIDYKTDHIKTIRSDFVNELNNNIFTIIVGAQSSGKTALSKMLFLYERYSDRSCILLNGDSFQTYTESKIQQTIENAFSAQYSPSLLEDFRQLPKEKKIIIIDDFDQIKFKKREIVFNYICARYAHVIILVSSGIEITSLFPSQGLQEESWAYYEILPLGNRKRYELINKWYYLGVDDLTDEEYNARIDKSRAQIDTLLGNGASFLPAMPVVIIAALQNIDATQNNLSGSKYGLLYESLIINNLSKISSDYIASSTFSIDANVLSYLAFHMLINKTARFKESELHDSVQVVNKKYLLSISTSDLLKKMTVANIICKDASGGDVYKFKYPYIFYYFAGRYIAYHIADKDVQDILEYMSSRLYIETYGNVIVFVCHFANNQNVIDNVLLSAYLTLESYSEFDFVKDEPVFDKIKDVIDLVVPRSIGNNESVDQHRDTALTELDVAGINDGTAIDEEEVIDDIEEELTDKEKDLISIAAALKTIEVLGEILQNYPGEIEGEDKKQIISEMHKLGMRSVQAIISTTGYLEEYLVEHAMARAEKQLKRYSKDEVVLATRKFVGVLISSMARGMIHQIATSLNSPYLLSATEKAFENDSSISSKLVLLDLKMNCLKHVSFLDIQRFKRELDSSNEAFASRILDSIVWYYLHFNKCDHALRAKLCRLCGFSEQEALTASQEELLT